ncbi:hypothetical protein LCGC14_3055330, partial [marine sediment metagenome]
MLLLLATVSVAQAEVVQEFTFEIKNVRTWGGFTIVYRGRSYDTAGVKPPPVTRSFYRLPAGSKLRRLFLRKKRFLCNAKYLNESKNPDDCKRARIGSGRVLVDIRPFLSELIPADFYMFLSKPMAKGAVATFTVLGIPDVSAPVVRDNWPAPSALVVPNETMPSNSSTVLRASAVPSSVGVASLVLLS